MSDLETLRRRLEEPAPPTVAVREAARAALRQRYGRTAGRSSHSIVVLATGVALAVAILAVVVTQAGPAAAWSSTPVSPPDPLLLASATTECAGVVDQADASRTPLLIDQRNDVAMALFGKRSPQQTSLVTCTLRETDQGWRRATADQLPFTLFSRAGSVDEEVLGSSIDRVVIDTGDERVTVSYHDGFYLIWWPEDIALTGHPMQFLAPDGSTVLEIPMSDPQHQDD